MLSAEEEVPGEVKKQKQQSARLAVFLRWSLRWLPPLLAALSLACVALQLRDFWRLAEERAALRLALLLFVEEEGGGGVGVGVGAGNETSCEKQ